MANRLRWMRPLASAALVLTAATAVLAAAGCTSAPAPAPAATSSGSTASGSTASGSSASTSGTAPALTAQARQVFASYLAAADTAALTGNANLARSDVTGVQKSMINVQLEAAAADGGGLARYRYGTPTFYLPQPAGYPHWFVASAQRTLIGPPASSGSPGNPDGTAGVPLPVSGRVLMVFVQTSATSPWLLASTSQLTPGASVPPLTVNRSGYVATVPLDSGAQLASPQITGPLQASVVDDGPVSPAAAVVAPGSLTTGMYAAARASATGLTAPHGDIYRWELEGSHYAKFALRMANGGAFVFYAMYLNSAVEVPAVLNKGVIRPGPPITVPGYLDFLLQPGQRQGQQPPRVRLTTQQLLSFAAVDPPAGGGKIRVVAMGGGLSYASSS